MNAIKHSLCATIVLPEDAPLIQDKAEALYNSFKPYTDYQAWHVDRAAVLMVRIERAERMERRVRDRTCLRSMVTWEDDRRLEAEVLGGMLSKKVRCAISGSRLGVFELSTRRTISGRE